MARIVEAEAVLEAGTAAAFDGHAQHRPGRLAVEDFADLSRRPFGHDHVVSHFGSAFACADCNDLNGIVKYVDS